MVERVAMRDLKGYLTVEQVNKLLECCITPTERLILCLLWKTGMRVSEMLGLRWSDIVFDENLIVVRRLKKRREVRHFVPFDDVTKRMLQQYRSIRKQFDNSERIFSLTRQAVFYAIRRIGRRAGIERVGEKRYIHTIFDTVLRFTG